MGVDAAYDELKRLIRGTGRAAVAYSCGVDSTVLCRVAHDVLRDASAAITVVSPMLPRGELDEARRLAAAEAGIAVVLDGSNLDNLSDYRSGLRVLQELGFLYVCMELRGCEMGSLNSAMGNEGVGTNG